MAHDAVGRLAVFETSLASYSLFCSRRGRISVSLSSIKWWEQRNIWGALSCSKGTLKLLKIWSADSSLAKVNLLDNKPPSVQNNKKKGLPVCAAHFSLVPSTGISRHGGAGLSQKAYNILSNSKAIWPWFTSLMLPLPSRLALQVCLVQIYRDPPPPISRLYPPPSVTSKKAKRRAW